MKARTRSGPTRSKAMSVAVLSLCVIIASRIERAGVVPVSPSRTGLPAVRTLSLTGSCSSSERAARLDVAEILAKDERLDCAGDKELVARRVGRQLMTVDIDPETRGSRKRS